MSFPEYVVVMEVAMYYETQTPLLTSLVSSSLLPGSFPKTPADLDLGLETGYSGSSNEDSVSACFTAHHIELVGLQAS